MRVHLNMLRNQLIIYMLLFSCAVMGQEINRVVINGQVTAPLGEDVEGISIYNVSAQEGTVTQIDGSFEIAVAENDRVLVTALQFQKFTVIVDEGVISNKRMAIYLNPSVNTLEEVIVRPYDLTGTIQADVARIKVVDFDSKMDLSYEALEYDNDFRDDAQSSIRGNAAEEAIGGRYLQYGFNPLGFLGLLFPKKDKANGKNNKDIRYREAIATGLRQRYSVHFFESEFGIDPLKVDDFIYFVDEQGLSADMLKAENEIELLSFLKEQSEAYKTRAKE
ncbi:MAG: hypothetical protein ABJM06_00875 [Gilvibacter sp.]